ncbi:hypothetical protein MLD38_011488 [Melastoma candidum]|uniref:Uncharacterized protein n=1 Tax=Melastoma candidum TaxID=119954 RepID=A0ACB9R3S4_9MYRT|nr:hypothetical protein MLD38_011488 [Melastoma candidum]
MPMTSMCSSPPNQFPPFLPKQAEKIKDPFARRLASRISRLPVNLFGNSVMSSCVKPIARGETSAPVVLLHGFDSSCLEWRYTYPLLEEAGLETWAIDILGWGFSSLESLPSCDVASKREHLFQLWKSHISRPMILVGPSLGAAAAIDFAVSYPEAVEKLVLIDASVFAEGTGNMANLPKPLAYAGVAVLKSFPLRFYVNVLAFIGLPLSTNLDWTNIGSLHCQYPWWADASVDFMLSGGYNVTGQISRVKQRTLIIWGENDKVISNDLAKRLVGELPNATLRQVPNCGHLPHVEKPSDVAKLIVDFVSEDKHQNTRYVPKSQELVS